jgi:hypothetical protein
VPVGLADLLEEVLDLLATALQCEQRCRGLASTAQRRHDDVVEVLGVQLLAGVLGLQVPALGEGRVDDVEPSVDPLGFAVSDENDFHAGLDGRGVPTLAATAAREAPATSRTEGAVEAKRRPVPTTQIAEVATTQASYIRL